MLAIASLRALRDGNNIELATAHCPVQPIKLWSRRPVEVRQLGVGNSGNRTRTSEGCRTA